MRSLSWSLSAVMALMALGCASSPTAPTSENPNHTPRLPQASLGESVVQGSRTVMPLGLYTLTLDLDNLDASIDLKQSRNASAAGDDTYQLCVNDFFPAPPIKITNIEMGAEALSLHYAIQHPFAAPSDSRAPASASNRADLAISGDLVWLVDSTADGIGLEPETYFTELGTPNSGITAITDFIPNARIFRFDPLIIDLGNDFTCNAFPALPLVDETNPECRSSSRTGALIISSGDDGNYASGANAGTYGWQRDWIVPFECSATGYGVLHQGQTASGVADLDLDGLDALEAAGEGITLDMAIIAHYNDPRGGTNAAEKKRNRLPAETPDPEIFFYAMPEGACPVAGVVVEQPAPWSAAASVNPIRCEVKDWFGVAGRMDVCIPGVLGDNSVFYELQSTPTGSGTPSDPFVWMEDIPTPVGVAPGNYRGVVRYTVDVTPSDPITLNCDLQVVTVSSDDANVNMVNFVVNS